MFNQEVSAYVKKKDEHKANMMKEYSLIYGQCSDEIQAKVESMPNHENISNVGYPIALLNNIKTVVFQFQTTKQMALSIHECKRRFYNCQQDRSRHDHAGLLQNFRKRHFVKLTQIWANVSINNTYVLIRQGFTQ